MSNNKPAQVCTQVKIDPFDFLKSLKGIQGKAAKNRFHPSLRYISITNYDPSVNLRCDDSGGIVYTEGRLMMLRDNRVAVLDEHDSSVYPMEDTTVMLALDNSLIHGPRNKSAKITYKAWRVWCTEKDDLCNTGKEINISISDQSYKTVAGVRHSCFNGQCFARHEFVYISYDTIRICDNLEATWAVLLSAVPAFYAVSSFCLFTTFIVYCVNKKVSCSLHF